MYRCADKSLARPGSKMYRGAGKSLARPRSKMYRGTDKSLARPGSKTYRGGDMSLARPGSEQYNIFVRNFLRCVALQGKKLYESSRLDVVEIARVPDMLSSLFPSSSG